MRCTQWYGLHKNADKFIKSFGHTLVHTDFVRRVYPDGSKEELESRPHYKPNLEDQESDRMAGMFQEMELDNYFLDGELLFEERVEHEPSSSGPMVHTALWDVKKDCWVPEAQWPKEDVEWH